MKQHIYTLSFPLLISIALFSSLNAQGHDASFRWVLAAVFLLLLILFTRFFQAYKQAILLPVNAISVSYAALFSWQLCSIFWSPAPSDTLLLLITSGLLPLALFAGFQLSAKQKTVLSFLLVLLVLMVATYTCYQAFVLKITRPAGFLLNWNTNAAFMGMILLPLR